MSLNQALSWYQNKIGSYDKQSFEQSIEKFILEGVNNVPKKSTKAKTDFIDVDLVRGTTYPKAKSQHGMFGVARKAVLRTLFMPFYLHWWQEQTTKLLAYSLVIAYVLQLSAMLIYFSHSSSKEWEDIAMTEVMSPAVLMIALGVIHSQVVSTYYPTSSFLLGGMSRKRTRRRRQSKIVGKQNCGGRRSVVNSSNCELHSDRIKQSTSSEDTCLEAKVNSELRSSPLLQSLSTDSGVSETAAQCSKAASSDSVFCDSKSVSFEWREDEHRNSPVKGEKYRRKYLDVPVINEDVTSDEARHDSAVQDVSSVELETDQLPSDTEVENLARIKQANMIALEGKTYQLRRRLSTGMHGLIHNHQSRRPLTSNSSGDSEGDLPSPEGAFKEHAHILPSDMEWGMTTNTDGEEQACGSDSSEQIERMTGSPSCLGFDDPIGYEFSGVGSSNLFHLSCSASEKERYFFLPGSRTVKVSCTIWEGRECKKAELCVLDISSSIVRKVAMMPQSIDYFVSGIFLAIFMALLPAVYRSHEPARDLLQDVTTDVLEMSMPSNIDVNKAKSILTLLFFGSNFWTCYVMLVVIFERFFLSLIFFFLLSVAERTFKQRFLHAKLFTHLTSLRRSRRSDLPYIRLNKVRNIKTWLSVRSYLKKHGPQRSVDVIVSAAFVIALILISFLCIQVLKESENFGERLYNWEVLCWSFALGVYLLRFMTLGAKINKKYRNFSAILTEQINLYVQMDQKPHKKESLILANNVLKLASQLLKELESPFKISGLSANPYLYNITKLVILSAFSAVLTEVLGFKLKLYKIKIK